MRYSLMLILVVLLAGCAKSPQQIVFQPVLATDTVLQGNSQQIDLDFVDGRSTKTIGSRGGAYEATSLITFDDSPSMSILSYVQNRLESAGYSVSSDNGDRNWVVTLEELTYQIEEVTSLKDMLVVTAKFSVQIKFGNSTYSNFYSAKAGEEIIGLASSSKNEAAVNRSLNSALDGMFSDEGINKFLK